MQIFKLVVSGLVSFVVVAVAFLVLEFVKVSKLYGTPGAVAIGLPNVTVLNPVFWIVTVLVWGCVNYLMSLRRRKSS